jgi:uncharacterized protein YndB with AHSA1/START domain
MTPERGTYEQIDGQAGLRFVRDLDHPIERVWDAVTTPEGLAAWFPCRIEGDLLSVGAALRFVFEDDHPEVEGTAGGTVLQVEPPTTLRFSWEAEEIRLLLEPHGRTGCRLTFIDRMPDDYTPGAARTAAGWHVCLDELTEHLHTGAGTAPGPEPTPQWRALYEAYVADGVPHGAPVPGAD